jgi:hypothetical protein
MSDELASESVIWVEVRDADETRLAIQEYIGGCWVQVSLYTVLSTDISVIKS